MTEREWALKALALLDAIAQRQMLLPEEHQTVTCLVGRAARPYDCLYCCVEAAQKVVREFPRAKAKQPGDL